MTFSEFDIIDRYFSAGSGTSDGVVLGSGDDCAILRVPDGFEMCISTDTLISGVHFPSGASGWIVAHRSLAASMSDLAAMGARPMGCILALTLARVDHTWLQAFSETLKTLSRRWQGPLIGGNLAKGQELSLTFTVMGTTPASGALKRSGARDGDDIYVTGSPGEAGAGLAMLRENPTASGLLVDRYYYPEPRLEIGQGLLGIATAVIDVSDGIAADLGHLIKASGVSATLELDAVPLSAALIESVGKSAARALALSAGDDYELCFTAPQDVRKQITRLAEASGIGITRIGHIETGGEPELRDDKGRALSPALQGYRHF